MAFSALQRLVVICLLLSAAVLAGCRSDSDGEKDLFWQLPRLAGELVPPEAGLEPVRLQFFQDTLFVSYNGKARIDKYATTESERVTIEYAGTIPLLDPEPVAPTSFVLIDSLLVLTDHLRNLVVVYDREGGYRQSFGTTPDGHPLRPFAVHAYGGVAYISDLSQRRALAVSLVNADSVTALGELILTIPADTTNRPGFPSAVRVTFDGRVLLGDASTGRVKAYTCDGRYIYDFDSIPADKRPALQAIDLDNVVDPSMQDSSSWDPSGIRKTGRYHVVDATNRRVHMFNSVGTYIASYPEDSVLTRPAGIAVDRTRGRIFVADPPAGRILVFTYSR